MRSQARLGAWVGMLVLLGWMLSMPPDRALAGEAAGLAYFKQAKINWRAYEGQKLTISLNRHPFTESLLPLIGDFENLTGIKVEYLLLPEPEYFSRLAVDLSQQRGEFPVILTGPMRNWQYAGPGWLLPLDGFLNDPKLTDRTWYKPEDFFPGMIAANRWNLKNGGGVGEGSLWAIPVLGESSILAYRKDLFDQYKIKVPTSLEEMVEAARQVKQNAGISGIAARGIPTAATVATGFISGIKSYGDGKWNELDEHLNPAFHDPRSVKFTQMWVDMVRESGPSDWANKTGHDAMESFAAGQAGMIADADLFAATYEDPKRSKVAGKVGYALIPAGPAGKTYAALWTWGLGISKAAKNKEAAWLFLQWATAPRTLLNATVEYRSYNPSRVSVMGSAAVQRIMGSWGDGQYMKTVLENLKTARVGWVPTPERTRLGDIWARALHEIYFKQASAEESLKRASAEAEKVLVEAGLKKK
jgi:multiple sugar transport system substrate-binding protein